MQPTCHGSRPGSGPWSPVSRSRRWGQGRRRVDGGEERFNLVRELVILGAGGILFVLGTIWERQLHSLLGGWAEYLVFGAAYLLAGWNVLLSAVRSIVRGRVFNEHFLMTIATAGAFAVHELPEAVGVMIFYKVGEILQELAVSRSRRSIRGLLDLRPAMARVMRNGQPLEVKPEQVAVGEVIVVRPGEKVPLDGVVDSGSGFVDTSALTGEPVPRRVNAWRRGPGRLHQHGCIPFDHCHEAGRGVERDEDHRPGREGDPRKGEDGPFHHPVRPVLHSRGCRGRSPGRVHPAASPGSGGSAHLGHPRPHDARHLLPVRACHQRPAGVLRRCGRRRASGDPGQGSSVSRCPGSGADGGLRQDRYAHQGSLPCPLGPPVQRNERGDSPAVCGAGGSPFESPHRCLSPPGIRAWTVPP